MKNALDDTFQQLRAAGRLAFIPYLTAGYPDAASSAALGVTMAYHGADILEIGVPFSDPLGDGPTIQRASTMALAGGMTLRGTLDLTNTIARQTRKPIVLMSYVNPLLRYGLSRFCGDAADAGACGLIVPDLPVEESVRASGHTPLRECCLEHGLHLIYLLAPTSTEARIKAVAAQASGFIYCMALAGVTGARATLADDLPAFLSRVRHYTKEFSDAPAPGIGEQGIPLVVGFGISQPQHIARLHDIADGAVVASALIDLLDATPVSQREATIGAYLDELSAVSHQPSALARGQRQW